ncbi:MAG: ParB/RepB/Spo0J family partition protein [Ruminococcus sp.]|nr:ParB/RepB/Spo0J family partition protein [Ruminococcus sp.]
MAKKDRMKNGLDVLFENNFHEESENGGESTTTLRLSLLEPDPDQPRTNFDEEKLGELSDNIREHGILQPILVRPMDNGSYRIVAGERRWRAARKAGLTEAPVVIRELTDIEAAQISLIENIQREDLDPIEEAAAYSRLMIEFDMTQDQVAKSVGKSRPQIANLVRLLSLPEEVQKMISAGEISVGHGKVLCGLEDFQKIKDFAAEAAKGLSVRELEKLIAAGTKPVKSEKPKQPARSLKNDEFTKFSITTQEQFKSVYGLNASVNKEKKGYSLRFDFDSEEELKELISTLSDKL